MAFNDERNHLTGKDIVEMALRSADVNDIVTEQNDASMFVKSNNEIDTIATSRKQALNTSCSRIPVFDRIVSLPASPSSDNTKFMKDINPESVLISNKMNKKMVALTVNGDGLEPKLVMDYEIPKRNPGEALIKVLMAGICCMDLEIFKGLIPFKGIPGHEFVGEVSEVDANSHLKIGDRVVADINIVCGSCRMCNLGGDNKRNHCLQRRVLGLAGKCGALAGYLTVPLENLHVVPENVSNVQATFVEPLSCVLRVVEQNIVKPEHSVAVVGDGRMGLLTATVLSNHCKKVTIFGLNGARMKRCLPKSVDKLIASEKTTNKYVDAFDVCVVAAGTARALMLAASLTHPLGVIVLKTSCSNSNAMVGLTTAPIVTKELTVIGSQSGSSASALSILANGEIDVNKFGIETFPFVNVLDAIKRAQAPDTLSVHLSFASS